MKDWSDKFLSEVVELNPTRSLKRNTCATHIAMDKLNPWARSIDSSIQKEYVGSGAKFKNGDTLLARITPCLENGKTAYVDFLKQNEIGHGSTEFIVLSGKDKITDNLYVYYLARLPEFRAFAMAKMEGTSGRQRVPSISLEKFKVKLPPLPIQRAIASILGSLDDKIELNRRTNETLEAMARAIYKSWFVDFDPVKAKAEGRKPYGMDDETAALFPDGFERRPVEGDSAVGRIPKGWREETLLDMVELIGGGTPKTNRLEYWNGDIGWFSVVDAPDPTDVFVISTEKKITQQGIENSSTKILPKGTTIISARGTVGKLALVGVPMAMNQSCYGIKPRSANSEYFTYFTIKHQVADLQQKTHGSIFDTITRETFSMIKQVISPVCIVVKFNDLVSPLMDQILANINASSALVNIRNSILPRLLSGELSIKDANQIAKATV